MSEFPFCVNCVHCKQQPIGETVVKHRRKINGRFVLPICEAAVDMVTGAEGEYCDTERAAGYCGVQGRNFSSAEPAPPPAPFSDGGMETAEEQITSLHEG